MSDPRDKIAAAIDRAERVAREAYGVPWVILKGVNASQVLVDSAAIRDEKWRVGHLGHVATVERSADAEHIALNDPAAVLRRCVADRRVLERHQRVDWYEGGSGCWYCSGEDEPQHRPVDWPCDDIRDLADRYGVTDD